MRYISLSSDSEFQAAPWREWVSCTRRKRWPPLNLSPTNNVLRTPKDPTAIIAIRRISFRVFRMDCRKIAKDVYALAALEGTDPLAPFVKEALDVIDHCLDSHGCVQLTYISFIRDWPNWRPDNVSLSFNGGKDCECILFDPRAN